MKPIRRNLMFALAALTPFLAQPSWGQGAESWPARPIRLITPSGAGAGSDMLARAMAERLGAALKQPVVVDNRPGASGMIATQAVKRAAPDGYTLLYTNASFTVMLQALQPELGLDVTRDLEPVAMTALGGVLLLVNPEVPARNLGELIALIKAQPGKYSYGSWGVGSNGHLTMEWLKSKTSMDVTHVPYKTMPSLLTELMSGTLKIGWSDPASPIPHIAAGKLRAIAINGGVRAPKLPDVPTMGEQGFAFPAVGWQGILAPPRTPPAILQRLHDEINKIQGTEELKALMLRMNIEPPPIWTSERFATLLRDDLQTWKQVVRIGNISADK